MTEQTAEEFLKEWAIEHFGAEDRAISDEELEAITGGVSIAQERRVIMAESMFSRLETRPNRAELAERADRALESRIRQVSPSMAEELRKHVRSWRSPEMERVLPKTIELVR